MGSRLRRAVRVFFAAVLGLSLGLPAAPAPLEGRTTPIGDPRRDWRTVEAERVVVIVPDALSALAREAAHVADRAWAFWVDALKLRPPWDRAVLVLDDSGDEPRVRVQRLPHPLIVLEHPKPGAPAWAAPAPWLPWDLEGAIYQAYGRLLLETAVAGPLEGLQGALGGIVAPGRWQPAWLKEGLPVALPALGLRTVSPGVAVEVEEALLSVIGLNRARTGRLPPLAQLSLPVDPDADPLGWLEARAASALFVRFLVETYGAEAIARLVRAYAEDPLSALTGRAAREILGRSLGEAYREFERWAREKAEKTLDKLAELEDQGGRARALSPLEGLSDGPAWSPLADELVYRHRDRGRPMGLRRLRFDGDGLGVASDQVLMACACGPPAWLDGDTLIYPKLTPQDALRRAYDVYTYDVRTGEEWRWTYGERVYAVAPLPDGRRALWARDEGDGRSSLLIYDFTRRSRRIVLELDRGQRVHSLAVSPDGREAALALWTRGEGLDLYTLQLESGTLRRLTRSPIPELTPAFSPDGEYVLFSSALDPEAGAGADADGLFEVYALRLEDGSLYRVTSTPGGGFSPAVSPDGRWLAFVSYDPEGGFRVLVQPYEPTSWEPVQPAPRARAVARVDVKAVEGDEAPYDPAPALRPTFWLPLVLVSPTHVGLRTGGADPLGWHRYALTVGASFAPLEAFYELAYVNARLLSPVLEVHAQGSPAGQRQAISLRVPFGWAPEAERAVSLRLTHENGVSELGARLDLLGRRSALTLEGGLRWVASDAEPTALVPRFALMWEERLRLGAQALSLRVRADWDDREGQRLTLRLASRFAPPRAPGQSEPLWACCPDAPGVLALSHPRATLAAEVEAEAEAKGAELGLDPRGVRVALDASLALRLTVGYGLLRGVVQMGGRWTLGEAGPQLYVRLSPLPSF